MAVGCVDNILQKCAASIFRVELMMRELVFKVSRVAAHSCEMSGTWPSTT